MILRPVEPGTDTLEVGARLRREAEAPEPGTMALCGSAALLFFYRRRKAVTAPEAPIEPLS